MITPRRIAGQDAMDGLAAVIGETAARALARDFGGTSVYVPRTVGEHHPLSVSIGQEAARQLSQWIGGDALVIPKQPEKRARVLELYRAGALTVSQIARETGYTVRHVYRLLREEDDARQIDLFD